ncbi:DNA-binding NarL/FixJ family response regulator [Kribbella aluminosa]|uniref:DNA-binding NarL/FixJ family response regulator n=1 Tax=Kribbella aluminosa TaxID=416017 RepID=A0ABS4UX65_9ACTN|nr:response regulator transcription factor [Kribbella aluminosa]MBP2356239.1 DNA-binding NarL/FixJ family response regulator [Kribbella aluminosa]
MIRVALVDDHPVVRAGIRALVDGEDDLTVVGEASDAPSAEQLVAAVRPDVVLMDLNLGPGPGGAEVTAKLRRRADSPYVLILTTYDTEAAIMSAIDAGASGYLLKDAPSEDLFRAIRGTARGETVLAPTVAARLIRRTGPTLTEREVEILGLLATGKSNRDLAKTLYVSEATIKSHLQHIYTKLEVETRAAAVARAIEQRIIRAVS